MIKQFGKTSVDKLIQLENEVKTNLPDEYKEFLLNSNGGSCNGVAITFHVEGIKESILLDILYGIDLKKGLNIIDWYYEYQEELPEAMFIIGHAIETGLILLVNQLNWKGIYFWDNCLDYEGSTEENCLYKITDSFDEFMRTLVAE